MFKIIKKITIKELILIIPIIGFIVIQVWLDLKIPDYMSEMTTVLQAVDGNINDILIPGGKMVLCALGSFASAVVTGYFVAYIAASFAQRIRKELFNKVEDFGMQEVKQYSVSSLVVRTTNDIANVQRFVAMGLQILIKSPILAIWAVTKIASTSTEWSILTGLAVAVLLVFVSIIIVLALPKTKKIQKLTDKLNTSVRENITGIRVIKAFNAEKFQTDKFETTNEDLKDTNIFINRIMSIMMPFMTLIMSSLSLSIYLTGAFIINNAIGLDRLTLFSDMVVFSSYAMQVIMSFIMLVIVVIMYPRSSVSAGRIMEVINTEIAIKNGQFKEKTDLVGEIEFKNVTFKYPDAEESAIENISFKASKGETVAIIGGTASGKTTLINLIPRFYDVTEGEILIDGINVKDYDLEYLYEKFGFVPQKAVIFAGSVKENIGYGSEKINKNLVEEASQVAQAEEFIKNLEKGLDSSLAARGTNISGGQKQRVAIARAVYRKPEFYIFDDSFSALDYKTDSLLRKALKKYTKESTSIIVAQRVGTIMHADKIIVMEEGKIVAMGTHKELLKKSTIYKEIAISQLSEKELNNE